MHVYKGVVPLCHFVILLIFKSTEVATETVLLTKWDDTLSSPNWPSPYPNNTNMIWIKSVSTGNRIQISVYYLAINCDGDFLEIRDGESMKSPLLARYCGIHHQTQIITSSGTHILLHFVSDNVTENAPYIGFTLRHAGLCKVHTNATSGVITTPNYPEDYPNFIDFCLWTIQLHPSVLITLECHDFALEFKEGCIFDYMEVLVGLSPDSPVLGRYCGVQNETLTFETQGNMSIRFGSDKDKEFKGFRCEYNIYKDYPASSLIRRTMDEASRLSPTTTQTTLAISKDALGSYVQWKQSLIQSTDQKVIHSLRYTPSSAALPFTTTSNNHTTMWLPTGISVFSSSVSTDRRITMGFLTTDRLNMASDHTVSSVRSTSTVFLSSNRRLSTTKSTDSLLRAHPPSGVGSSRKPHSASSTEMMIHGSMDTHQLHTGSLAARITPLCDHASSRVSLIDVSGTRHSFGKSTGSKLTSDFQGQSQGSPCQVRTTLSSLDSTVPPSNAVPSHPPSDEAPPPTLLFPWHLIPFIIVILILTLALLTYYLRIPNIVDTIIISIKDKRKKTKAAKSDQSRNLNEGNFFPAGFKASAFHSYQREIFYDDALNYAMFEKNTKAVEFSFHLEEDQQSLGSEESVEISCVMEEESADKTQVNNSLSEMFDIMSSKDIIPAIPRAGLKRTTHLHDSTASYEI